MQMQYTSVNITLTNQNTDEIVSDKIDIYADIEDSKDWLREVLIQSHSSLRGLAKKHEFLTKNNPKVYIDVFISTIDERDLWSYSSIVSSTEFVVKENKQGPFFTHEASFENVFCIADPDIGTDLPKRLL